MELTISILRFLAVELLIAMIVFKSAYWWRKRRIARLQARLAKLLPLSAAIQANNALWKQEMDCAWIRVADGTDTELQYQRLKVFEARSRELQELVDTIE